MSNYRQDPFINLDSIQKMQQELGRLFEGDWIKPSERYSGSGDWTPSMDTVESESHWTFLMELPGIALSDIDVSAHRGQIIVKGQKTSDAPDSDVVHRERAFGRFERIVTLPDDTDESSLDASMKNGVLQLMVTKSSNSGARPITVKSVD